MDKAVEGNIPFYSYEVDKFGNACKELAISTTELCFTDIPMSIEMLAKRVSSRFSEERAEQLLNQLEYVLKEAELRDKIRTFLIAIRKSTALINEMRKNIGNDEANMSATNYYVYKLTQTAKAIVEKIIYNLSLTEKLLELKELNAEQEKYYIDSIVSHLKVVAPTDEFQPLQAIFSTATNMHATVDFLLARIDVLLTSNNNYLTATNTSAETYRKEYFSVFTDSRLNYNKAWQIINANIKRTYDNKQYTRLDNAVWYTATILASDINTLVQQSCAELQIPTNSLDNDKVFHSSLINNLEAASDKVKSFEQAARALVVGSEIQRTASFLSKVTTDYLNGHRISVSSPPAWWALFS